MFGLCNKLNRLPKRFARVFSGNGRTIAYIVPGGESAKKIFFASKAIIGVMPHSNVGASPLFFVQFSS